MTTRNPPADSSRRRWGTRPSAAPSDCPCHSGERYAACCGPFHDGTRVPATPVELMRSRYAAFARGLGEYLVETLSADHSDRAHDSEARARALSRVKETG